MSGNPSTQDVPASSKLANIEFTELLAMESMLADLSLKARQVASESGLTRREIAKRMGTRHLWYSAWFVVRPTVLLSIP